MVRLNLLMGAGRGYIWLVDLGEPMTGFMCAYEGAFRHLDCL